MAIACVETPHALVALESERLRVTLRPDRDSTPQLLGEIPLCDLESLTLNSQAHVTTPALVELMRRGIPLYLTDSIGRALGTCLPMAGAYGGLRSCQYARSRDPAFNLAVAVALIDAKIYNQRRLLQRLHAARAEGDVAGTDGVDGWEDAQSFDQVVARLDELRRQLSKAPNLEALRGLEGLAAAQYFQAWSAFLPPGFPFERRSTRPPHNAVNAVISYTSALLYHQLVSLLHQRGFDPALGHLHVADDGRWSLALDLMEPFRPVLLEGLATRLFSLRQLQTGNFEPREGGIYLNTAGRRATAEQFHRRLDREFYSEHRVHRTTLRQQLVAAVQEFRRTLEHGEPLQPFRLN